MLATYEQNINDLIPIAEKAANRVVAAIYTKDTEEEYQRACAKWNEVYHNTMDRLAALNGIRRTTRPGCQ